MTDNRTFYKTTIIVTVLSEEPYTNEHLYTIAHDIIDGECSGDVTNMGSEELNAEEMADALIEQGSDPEFFNISTEPEDDEEPDFEADHFWYAEELKHDAAAKHYEVVEDDPAITLTSEGNRANAVTFNNSLSLTTNMVEALAWLGRQESEAVPD